MVYLKKLKFQLCFDMHQNITCWPFRKQLDEKNRLVCCHLNNRLTVAPMKVQRTQKNS